MVTQIEFEQGHLGGWMNLFVIRKFDSGEVIDPVVLLVIDDRSQHLLYMRTTLSDWPSV